jgi:hypothetical protein
MNLIRVQSEIEIRANHRSKEIIWFKSEFFMIRIDQNEASLSLFECGDKVCQIHWTSEYEVFAFRKWEKFQNEKTSKVFSKIFQSLPFKEWKDCKWAFRLFKKNVNGENQ